MNQASSPPPVPNRWGFEDLGLGVGLRRTHYHHIVAEWPEVDWFEIVSENFLDTEGWGRHVLEQVAERYPVAMHGVSMSIGSTDPIDYAYLAKLKTLARQVDARWLGDHVCWTGVAGWNSHDLLPIPYHEQSLEHVVGRVRAVQEFLERPIVLENASTYLAFRQSTIPESKYLRMLAEEADCGLLLDVNNVYVSCRNHGLDPWEYLADVPWDRVVQIHLAGHEDRGTHCLDTHSAPVIDAVWELYAEAHRRTGGRATLLEWDNEVPSFERVHEEALKAARHRTLAERAP